MSDYWIRTREAQKHIYPTDPDPQHWVNRRRRLNLCLECEKRGETELNARDHSDFSEPCYVNGDDEYGTIYEDVNLIF
jgi:hypothetical protein